MFRKTDFGLPGRLNIASILLMIIIIFQFLSVFQLSLQRYFNFDEFRVLYSSVGLLRGEKYYSDGLENHFPLVSILLSWLVQLSGYETTTLILSRLFILFCISLLLFFVYRITKMICENETSSLLSVGLVLSSFAFIHKGIEIRHDVFNALLNVIGVYYVLLFLKGGKNRDIYYAAFFLGCSLAATQKAVIWNAGIIISLLYVNYTREGAKKTLLLLCRFTIVYAAPLLASLIYVIWLYDDSFFSFFNTAIAGSIRYLDSTAKSTTYPFPYSKWTIYSRLIYDNGLFYGISIVAMFYYIIKKKYIEPQVFVVSVWGVIGLFFYLYMRRPFYQSFLPTVPAMAILVPVFFMHMNRMFSESRKGKWLHWAEIPCIIVMLVLPLKSLTAQSMVFNPGRIGVSTMEPQMENIAFCLNNLERDDVVFSFTEQQVFFKSLFCCGLSSNECGKTLYEMEAFCLKDEIINQQCKVIINDHRTRLLNKDAKELIRANYFPINIGDILIPGFIIPPGREVRKEIWIAGHYFSPTSDILFDNEKPQGDVFQLDQKFYTIKNLTEKSVMIVYIFDTDSFNFTD